MGCFLLELNLHYTMRRLVISFIGGCHHLRVEVGRWHRVPGPARVCRLCDSGSVEDEMHVVLFSCHHFSDQREAMLLSVIRQEGYVMTLFWRFCDRSK